VTQKLWSRGTPIR